MKNDAGRALGRLGRAPDPGRDFKMLPKPMVFAPEWTLEKDSQLLERRASNWHRIDTNVRITIGFPKELVIVDPLMVKLLSVSRTVNRKKCLASRYRVYGDVSSNVNSNFTVHRFAQCLHYVLWTISSLRYQNSSRTIFLKLSSVLKCGHQTAYIYSLLTTPKS